MGRDEWLEVAGLILLAILIGWKRRTLSELIRWTYYHSPTWAIVLPFALIALGVFLYWHLYGWRWPWSGA
jgi:hypothetical protein